MGGETDQSRHEGKKYGEWYLRHDPNQAPLPGTRPYAADGTRPADGASASRQVSSDVQALFDQRIGRGQIGRPRHGLAVALAKGLVLLHFRSALLPLDLAGRLTRRQIGRVRFALPCVKARNPI